MEETYLLNVEGVRKKILHGGQGELPKFQDGSKVNPKKRCWLLSQSPKREGSSSDASLLAHYHSALPGVVGLSSHDGVLEILLLSLTHQMGVEGPIGFLRASACIRWTDLCGCHEVLELT